MVTLTLNFLFFIFAYTVLGLLALVFCTINDKMTDCETSTEQAMGIFILGPITAPIFFAIMLFVVPINLWARANQGK